MKLLRVLVSLMLDIRQQYKDTNVSFEFKQCETYFIKDGKEHKLQTKYLIKQTKLSNIDYKSQK